MMFANMPSMLPQVRGGKLKGLGVTSAGALQARARHSRDRRDPAGLCRDLVVRPRRARPARPRPIVAMLEAAIGEALANPEIQRRWKDDLGLDMPTPGRAAFAAFVAADRRPGSRR
jgi:tripartite-type tricarboxylate transporter receptor subunit TctC